MSNLARSREIVHMFFPILFVLAFQSTPIEDCVEAKSHQGPPPPPLATTYRLFAEPVLSLGGCDPQVGEGPTFFLTKRANRSIPLAKTDFFI
jgi:hypothetical protein